jgi:YggT family protein
MIIWLINVIINTLTLLIIIKVLLSYFVSPYHPVREAVDRIVRPLLDPIRRIMPPTGGFDFSPIMLLILIQIVGSILKSLL